MQGNGQEQRRTFAPDLDTFRQLTDKPIQHAFQGRLIEAVLDFPVSYQSPGKARSHTPSALTTQLPFNHGTEQGGCAWRPKRFGPQRAGGPDQGRVSIGPFCVLALAPLICGLPFAPGVRVSAVPGIQRSTDRLSTSNCVSVYLAGWPPHVALLFSSSSMGQG